MGMGGQRVHVSHFGGPGFAFRFGGPWYASPPTSEA
jgi:hypothetical protein